MCDTLLKSICRLCLKDNFSLSCIFTCRSPSLEPVSVILENIYDLKICEGDELPSQICVPCLWRVFEFDMYRKNVKYAEQELRNMLRRTYAISNEVPDEGTDNVTELTAEREKNVASDPMEGIGNDSEVSIKIEIEEWEMPQDIPSQRGILENVTIEAGEDVVKETEISTDNDFEHYYAGIDGQTEELEELQSSNIHSSECLAQMDVNFVNASSKKSSSVVSTSEISRNNKLNKEICEESIKNDLFTEKESFFSLKSKSDVNSAISGLSSSRLAVLSKMKPFVCDVCKKSFGQKRHISDHVRVHYNDRPFKCRECGKSFKRESTKIEHELRHVKQQKENEEDKKRSAKKCYVCEICKKEFNSLDTLCRHSNQHKNKYLCTFCGRSCCTKYDLNLHLRIHTNEKPFSCEVCKRTFNFKSNLKRHLATHSDNCPYQCDTCDKRFKTQSQKSFHELFHLRSK